jgi:nascent polypeptide-associated complex subunit alpha
MFGGGGGLDPRKMKQMMEQMGIDVEELDATEVVIRTGEEELVFSSPAVTKMDARGQETYQVVGDPEVREGGEGDYGTEFETDSTDGPAIPDDDVDLVVARTGASEADAREALEAVDGDLAAAVDRLE